MQGHPSVNLPARADVRRAFPNAEIDLNTLPPWQRLFEGDPRFRKVIAFPLRGQGIKATLRWLREVRSNRYALICDFQSDDRSRILLSLLKLSGAGVKFVPGNQPRFPYDLGAAALPSATPAVTRLRANVASAGIPAATPLPTFHVAPRHRERAAALLRAHPLAGKRYAV